jgi:hypothetical protein
MNRRLCDRAVVAVVALSGLVSSGACAIADNRDGIGRLCTTDAACPLDHFCLLDQPAGDVDVAEGRCAPVVDYGESCPQPSWPVKSGGTLEGNQDIKAEADLLRFVDVTSVVGQMRILDDAGASVELGDLCGLAGLQRVTGALMITETDAPSLDGLQALAAVGGGILVVDNVNLVDVSALANLQFAPPPEGRNFPVLFARNTNLEVDAVNDLANALEPAGIRVFECGNKGAGPCNLDLPSLLGER